MPFQELQISQLNLDAGTQSRAEPVSDAVVREYAGLLADGVKLPPISVVTDGTHYWPTDGFTRLRAEMSLGSDSIRANVMAGTLEDARWASLAANKAHGVARSNADKRRALEEALDHPRSSGMKARELARHLGLHHSTVSDEINRRAGVGIRQSESNKLVKSDPAPLPEERVGSQEAATTQLEPPPSNRHVAEAATPQAVATEPTDAVAVEREPSTGTDGLSVPLNAQVASKPTSLWIRQAEEALGQLFKAVDRLHSNTDDNSQYRRCRNLLKQVGGSIRAFKDCRECGAGIPF